jgi:hypothetical protein
MLRVAILTGILSLSSLASAERLIFIPTAKRLADFETRAEVLIEGLSLANRQNWLSAGFGGKFEVELYNEKLRNGLSERSSFNFSMNLLPALTDFGAGFAVGILDAANQTSAGRGVYGVFTLRSGNYEDQNAKSSTDLSLGFGTYPRFKGVFIGLRHPFTDYLKLLAEYDSRQTAFGFEVIPTRGMTLKWVAQEKQTFVGLSYSLRF